MRLPRQRATERSPSSARGSAADDDDADRLIRRNATASYGITHRLTTQRLTPEFGHQRMILDEAAGQPAETMTRHDNPASSIS